MVPPVRFSVGSDDEPTRPSTPEDDPALSAEERSSTGDSTDGGEFLFGLRVDDDETGDGADGSGGSRVSSDATDAAADGSSTDVNNNSEYNFPEKHTAPFHHQSQSNNTELFVL